MKANNDKQLEKFTDKLMKEASLDKPSIDFTTKVMAEVLVTDTGAVVYKPLISKQAWVVIFGGIIAITAYVISSGSTNAVPWLDKFNLPEMNMNNIMQKSLAGFKFSKISLYAVVLLGVMLFVQISYLKRYLSKRAGN